MKKHVLNRFAAGLLVMIPVAALGWALFMLVDFIQWFGEPLFERIEGRSRLDSLIENTLVALGVLVAVYLLGFAADLPPIRSRVDRLDRTLAGIVPGYTLIKGVIGGTVQEEELTRGLRPVLVDTGLSERVGFEMDRAPSGRVLVFLPNVPAANTGQLHMVEAAKVRRLNVSPLQVLDMQAFYGAGMMEAVERDAPGGGRPGVETGPIAP